MRCNFLFATSHFDYATSRISSIYKPGDIAAYEFSDKQLKTLAYQYVDALNLQLEGIKYYGADSAKYNQLWGVEGRYQRARIICQLADNYGLSFSSNHASSFDELVSLGRVLLELDEVEKSMTNIISGDITLESLGGTSYECVIKNDSPFDLSGAQIKYNLYDDKGILVDTATAYMNSWQAGNVNKCDLYISNEFTKAEASIQLYSQSLGDYLTTDYYPIEYINNMIINITLKNSLPREISYTCIKKPLSALNNQSRKRV